MNIFKQIYNFLRWRKYFVIMDPEDNSITVSKALYKHIDRHFIKAIDVFMFRVPATNRYAFTINPVQEGWLTEEELHGAAEEKFSPSVSELLFDTRCKSIGFAASCPTVNLMLTEWNRPLAKTKVTVKPQRIYNRLIYVLWQ